MMLQVYLQENKKKGKAESKNCHDAGYFFWGRFFLFLYGLVFLALEL